MATLQEEIAAKANITVDQAKLAYDHVLQSINSKIPPSISEEIHKVLDGHEFNLDSVKTKIQDTAHDWQQKAADAFHNLTDQAKSLLGGEEHKS